MLSLGLSMTTSAVLRQSISPLRLFAAGEQGQMSEVNPLRLYQDTAGTTPVTATGQSVALQLDQSKGLVLGPELVTNGDFSAGSTGWTVSSQCSIGSGVANIVSSDGSFQSISQNKVLVGGFTYELSFDIVSYTSGTPRFTFTGASVDISFAGGTGRRTARFFIPTTTSSGLVFTRLSGVTSYSIDNISVRELPGNHDTQATVGSRPIYGKHPANGYRNMLAASDAPATQNVTTLATQKTLSFTGTGTVTLTGTYVGALVGTGAGNRVTLTFTPTAGTLTLTVSGSVTFAQLQDGAAFDTYQRTGASSGAAWPAPPSYDITEAGQPDLHYLHFNGVSSFMVSPTITPGIDKAQVFMGVRKLRDAATAILIESSVSSGTNAGSFYITAPESIGAASDFRFKSRGSVDITPVTSGAIRAPVSTVLSGIGDIAADTAILRSNGAQVASTTTDQGTGNYLPYPIYTGRRGGTSLPFNGLVYSKIVRFGPNLTADQITATERWTAQHTGVSL